MSFAVKFMMTCLGVGGCPLTTLALVGPLLVGGFRRWWLFEMFSRYFFDNLFVSSFRNSGQLVIGFPGSILYSFTISVFLSFC